MPLPPLIRERLMKSTEVVPDTRLPLKYRRLAARAMEEDFAWLLAHPDKRVRVRRAVFGEFWPCFMDLQDDRWVAVVFKPTYSGALGYSRVPLWEEHLAPFSPEPPAARYEVN
jgi:hypothetical protein